MTHANHKPVVFRITVKSSTKIYGVETHDEGGDAVIEHADDHAVTLRATNWGYLDGMNFRTACGRGIEVSGTIDGHPLDAAARRPLTHGREDRSTSGLEGDRFRAMASSSNFAMRSRRIVR